MTEFRHKKYSYNALPFILFFIAVLFLVVLLFSIKTGVFFSGDAGLKYLVIRQISKGGIYHILNLESAAWVSDIWRQGYYPFNTPFIYDEPVGKIVSFPPAFQWISAQFYKWFGYRGIYIVPCLSVVGLWLWLINLLSRVGVKPLIISLGIFLLAFCSPLTIYGAVYWEHSFAVLLIFGVVSYLVHPPASPRGAILLGILSGSAVWFRPEMLLLLLLVIAVILYNFFFDRNKAHVVFTCSAIALITAFFIFNSVVYGSSLGAHSYQLANVDKSSSYLREKFTILAHVNARLVIYFPVIILFYALAVFIVLRWCRRQPIRFEVQDARTKNVNLIGLNLKPSPPLIIIQLTVITILFSLITPFILPNAGGKQWGPRYFLPLIPIVIIILCLAANYFAVKKPIAKIWGLLLALIVIYSVYLNVYQAHKTLQDDYAFRVKPGLNFLEKNTCEILVVQNQYIAQEFAALFDKKKIFLAEDKNSFSQLEKQLRAAGIERVIYMASDSNNIMLPYNLINRIPELKKVGAYYFAEYDL